MFKALESEEHKSSEESQKTLTKKKSSFFPTLLDEQGNEVQQEDSNKAMSPRLRMKGAEALQIGLLLGQQEREHGENMYDLSPAEEQEVHMLVQQGMTSDEAALQIFNRKHYPATAVVNEEGNNIEGHEQVYSINISASNFSLR